MTHESSRTSPPSDAGRTVDHPCTERPQTEDQLRTQDQPAQGQPFVHDARLVLWAPSFVASRADGDLAAAVDGFYHGDRRYLRSLRVSVDGVHLAATNAVTESADRAVFEAVLRQVGQSTADPAVTLRRERSVQPARFTELVEVVNHGSQQVTCTLRITAQADFAAMDAVKAGTALAAVEPACEGQRLTWTAGGDRLSLTASEPPADVRVDGPTDSLAVSLVADTEGTLLFELALAPGETWRRELTGLAESGTPTPFEPVAAADRPWDALELTCADSDFTRLLAQSEQDLARLLLADPQAPTDVFAAAGAPWFLTLFGRDSLWTARMLLPLGTELAAGTLRTLARRQGRATVAATEEQPGKILHEVRAEQQELGDGTRLPPRYFGTIDATPLWITLLHDAWRWGLPDSEVAELLPQLEAALNWLTEYGDPDGDGLLEYIDSTGTGLANQGWKDSGDSIRFRDGSQAKAPIALCEVQAYAYEAALAGATLLDAFHRPGAAGYRSWAARLQEAFRRAFWVADRHGRYPAIALDADKRPVDSVTSGMGHLLGTGLLDAEESRLVADRLLSPGLADGYGLRTYAAENGGYNPLGYHVGSIWPHDTAIAVHGLAKAGFPDHARRLAERLIAAGPAFEARLPELFAGTARSSSRRPAPYPASCRPQAWAAAAPVALLQALLGLQADVPAGRLTVHPAASRLLPLSVRGLRVAGVPLTVQIAADGTVQAQTSAAVEVLTSPPDRP
ncbi:amylo-alpha-1,6-glucosidase [Kitasatospora kifunensis]|uniref:Glycogen debranching enzyme n=1 Tax=Kitasatospora kifunensis TaxID=58351 RepID=A0A7W7VSN1_KITKI|nr:glycogen debranching N-terminal domain-containing protein [Kitasatospora kifunensis]MBB4921361.1 glycogen debranching enzyme [Kitasatospora kifunensis]